MLRLLNPPVFVSSLRNLQFYKIRKYPSVDELAAFCPSISKTFALLEPCGNKQLIKENKTNDSVELIRGIIPVHFDTDLEVRR